MQKIRAEIHLGNIRRNAECFSALTKKPLCAVVKANAYGHGAEEVVNALESVVDFFAVALVDEAIAIRVAACGKDILVFAPPIGEREAYEMIVNGFLITVSDLWTAKLVANVCKKYRLRARVHLKMNTGMNRYGMNASMLGKVCRYFLNTNAVFVEGIYTHLYSTNRSIAEEQRQIFIRQIRVCKKYFPLVNAHMGGTYAALLGEKFAFDTTRIGLGLYGYLPSTKDVTKNVLRALPLEKGMTVSAVTAANRTFSYGGVGYGKKVAKKAYKGERLSICRVGYADGFLRRRENGMDGHEQNVNNLCMDVCIRKNGKRRGQWNSIMTDAEQTAKETGTISYEVLCAATRRAELIYDNE